MGKKKFRMTHKKNFEKKKYEAARQLIVKILISSYFKLAGSLIPEQPLCFRVLS